MADIGTTNISFSGLKAAYVAGGATDADGNSNLNDGNTNTEIRLSFFRNAGLSDGTSISGSDEISINSLKEKIFGSPELFSSFLEISNRVIDDSTAADYTGNYDVSETEVPSGGYHHIYIGFKATSSQMYYSDICIAGVQVVDKNNNNKQIWIFNSGTTTDHVWKTKVGTVGIQTATGFPITPSTASSYGNSNYVTLGTTATYDRASIATETTSSNTGAADGISGSTTNLVVGNGTMSQSTGTYYVFRETSGTSSLILDSGVVMRSPEIELRQGDKIRVAHLVVSHPSYPQDENDSLYLGVYPIDLTSKFVEISNRFIIDTTTADYTGNYDVSETQVNVSGNHNIYIGIKVTAPSPYTFYNDVAIAGVQIVNKENQVQKTWIFNSVPSTSSTDQWQTYNGAVTGSSSAGFPINPQTASGYSYSNMVNSGSSTLLFRYTTSTGSVNTGANDGIATTTSAFPLGDSTISQSSNTLYVYRETSGSTLWSGTVMRSPVYNFTSGDKVRVAHLVVGNSSYQMDPLDTLYLGVYPGLVNYSVTFNFTNGNLSTVSITINGDTSGSVTRGNSLTLTYSSDTNIHTLLLNPSGADHSIDTFSIVSGGTGTKSSLTHSGTSMVINFTVTD